MGSTLLYVGGVNRGIGYVARPSGKGIAAFRLDNATGTVTPLGITGDIDNPTFLAVAPDGATLVAVSELDGQGEGIVTAFRIDAASGRLHELGRQSTLGTQSCHLGFEGGNRFVGIANYSAVPADRGQNNSFVVYPRRSDGGLAAPAATVTHGGRGPNAGRQERPHAHCIRWTPDGRFVIVADLGIDRLMIYRFDAENGAVSPHGEAVLPPGAGPRHFRFHPGLPVLYCANELDSTLATMAFDAEAGTLQLIGLTPTLPGDHVPGASCSAIDLGGAGRHVYIGNRGPDSISRFVTDRATGLPTFLGATSSGGCTPRDFAFEPSGETLAVANQDSDCVTLFRYRPETGDLDPTGPAISVGSPTAVAFHPGRS